MNKVFDVNITNPQHSNFLVYNSSTSKWENTNVVDIDTLSNLSDTTISSPQDAQFLRYDAAFTQKWINTDLNLNGVKDVNISSLQNNQVLKYNSTSGKWENAIISSTVGELSDVYINNLQDLQMLAWSHSAQKWINFSLTISQPTTALLADTNITGNSLNLANGHVLQYNGTNWVNAALNLFDGNAATLTGTLIKERLPSTMNTTSFNGILQTVAGVNIISGNDFQGKNVILGGHNQSPKITMQYFDDNRGAVYDKNISIGQQNIMPNTGGGPCYPPTNSLGINFQNNSDGVYFGIYEYATGNYRPVLKWGDDSADSPFSIEKMNPSGNVVNHWDFHHDGLFTSKKLELDESIKAAKTGSNYRMELDSTGRMALNYNGVSNIGASSNHTDNNIMLDGLYGNMSCKGDLRKYYTSAGNTVIRFSVNYLGQGYFAHSVTATSFVTSSDDRLKHNEEVINNGLEILAQLSPQKYDKTIEFDSNIESARVEAGFIAQEVLQTDVSWAVVKPEDPETQPYSLDYSSLFTYAVAAIKELNVITKTLENRIAVLEGK